MADASPSAGRRLLWHLIAAAWTAVLLAAVVVLGQIPMGKPSGEAVLRLALRTVQAKIEVCRQLSAEEIAALPQHMRREETCEQVSPPYRLLVAIDGETVIDERFEAGGMRRDRPLIVDRQIRWRPGPAAADITFRPELESAEAAELPSYRLARSLELTADRITLVTLDEANRSFTVLD